MKAEKDIKKPPFISPYAFPGLCDFKLITYAQWLQLRQQGYVTLKSKV